MDKDNTVSIMPLSEIWKKMNWESPAECVELLDREIKESTRVLGMIRAGKRKKSLREHIDLLVSIRERQKVLAVMAGAKK